MRVPGCQSLGAGADGKRLVVDAQVHVWTHATPELPWIPGFTPQLPEPLTIERILPMMDEAGVDRVVVVPSVNISDFFSKPTAQPGPFSKPAIQLVPLMRYFLQRDAALQGTVLRIFLSVVERCLREHSPSSPADARIGAVAFIHRFGSSLNEHVHFHCCIIDGVFAPVVTPDEVPGVRFHAALEFGAAAFADVQARVRTRVLRTFVRHGLIDNDDATEMRAWAHDGGCGRCCWRASMKPCH